MSEQKPEPLLVGWCPSCQFVFNPYPGPGTPCEGDDWEKDRWPYHHRLHKRRMWKCGHDNCHEWDGPSYFLSAKDMKDHEVEYAKYAD